MSSRGNGDHGRSDGGGHTQDDALRTRLNDLGSRISKASGKPVVAQDASARGNAMGLAFRLAAELVAGLVVGGLIGWALDRWLGTSPIMLLVFFALGSVAGILNVVRTARQMQQKAVAEHGWGKDLPDQNDD